MLHTDRHEPSPERSELPPSTPPCDLVTVPTQQGLEAVDILRLRTRVGPVLHDDAGDGIGFLVPQGTADGWDLPGSSCTRSDGRGFSIGAEPSAAGSGWLVPPDGGPDRITPTDPAVLRAALGEAARTIKLAGGV